MKILIVKTSSLGDLIHAFPTLQYLKQKFPHAQIDWVVEKPFADLVQAHPAVHDVLRIDTRTWRSALLKSATWHDIGAFRKTLREVKYDVVFDLQGNLKSGVVCSQTVAKIKIGFGKETIPEWPNLLFTDLRINPPPGNNIREDYLFLAQSYFEDFTPFSNPRVLLKMDNKGHALLQQIMENPLLRATPKVMVCPGSAWRNKQVEKGSLIEFLTLLYSHLGCAYLFLWGTPEERQLADELKSKFNHNALVLERLPLPVLQNAMDQMDLVVAMDSLPLHLAGTTSVKTFSVFGASSADKYKPQGEQHHAFQGTCPYKRAFEKRCPVLRSCQTGPCIRSVTGQTLFDAFLQDIQKQPRR